MSAKVYTVRFEITAKHSVTIHVVNDESETAALKVAEEYAEQANIRGDADECWPELVGLMIENWWCVDQNAFDDPETSIANADDYADAGGT